MYAYQELLAGLASMELPKGEGGSKAMVQAQQLWSFLDELAERDPAVRAAQHRWRRTEEEPHNAHRRMRNSSTSKQRAWRRRASSGK